MGRSLLAVLWAIVLVIVFAVPTMAWEFKMTGQYEYRFRYFGQVGGDKDLFGRRRVQDHGPLVGFAGPNIYGYGYDSNINNFNAARVKIVRGGFSASGSDAHDDAHRFTMFPTISVNQAIHFFSVVNLGGYRNKYNQSLTGADIHPPFERYYTDRLSVNAFDTAMIPSVEQFKTIIHMPFGTLSLGAKDFPFGTGATLAQNTRASAFLLVLNYGPFQFMPSIWLSRLRLNEGWHSVPDGAKKNTAYPSFAFIYNNGPIQFGYLGAWRWHTANAYESPAMMIDGTRHAPFDDYSDIEGVFLKYFNGRFFSNLEFAMMNIDRRYVGRMPYYAICRHFFVETGVFSGPAKVSLLGVGTTGFALNNPNKTIQCVPVAINYQALAPYELLMFTTYAGGNNGGWRGDTIPFTSDENGQMADAFGFAGRIDYAVAANLNVWGTYMWAHRTEKNGHYAGGTASTGGPGAVTATAAQNWKALNTGLPPAGLNPYVDDGFIGWEYGLGADWKLLEGVTARFRYAQWFPGPWFDQAYQAVTVRGGNVVTDGMVIGRDPIVGFQASLFVDF